jgi:hypothetical protein
LICTHRFLMVISTILNTDLLILNGLPRSQKDRFQDEGLTHMLRELEAIERKVRLSYPKFFPFSKFSHAWSMR